jgi:hypothetical protein
MVVFCGLVRPLLRQAHDITQEYNLKSWRRVVEPEATYGFRGNVSSVIKAVGLVSMHRVVKDIVFPWVVFR